MGGIWYKSKQYAINTSQFLFCDCLYTPTQIIKIFNFILNIKFSPSLILINFNDALNENFHETLEIWTNLREGLLGYTHQTALL